MRGARLLAWAGVVVTLFGCITVLRAGLTAKAVSTVALDTFNRSVSGGWGSADTGGAWTLVDTPANWSVAPGAGSIVVDAGTQQRGFLGAVSVQDVELLESVTLPRSTQNNNTLAYVLGRYSGGSNPTYYRVGVGQGAGGGSVILRAQRDDNTSVAADVSTGIPAGNAVAVSLRVQIQGVNPTTIRARAWPQGTTEPTTWQLTATDSNAAQQISGAVGIRGRNDDTTASHTFTFQTFQATDLSTGTPTPTPTPTATSTPLPPGTTLASDSYNRTVTGGWGSADTGGAWTIVDTPASWNVAPGAGSVAVGTLSQQRAYLGAVSVQDVDILESVALPRSTQSNNAVAYILGRYTPGSNPTYYRVGVGQGAGGSTVILRAQRSDGPNVAADVSTGIAASDGAVVLLRVQFQGVNPTTIRARAWASGSAEPSGWPLTGTDSNAAEQVAGAVGVRGRNEDTAAAHTFTYQNFVATSLSGPVPTPTPTPTSTPTPTPTATPTATPTPTPTPTPAPGTLASDGFSRSATAGWGAADTGGPWTVVGSPWSWSVSAGAGSVAVNAEERAYLSKVNSQDVDVTMKVVLPRSTQSNNTLAYILTRYTAAYVPSYYRVGVGQGAGSSSVILRAERSDGGSLSPDLNTGIAAADGVTVWLHVQVQGVNPTAVRARAWVDGAAEPANWLLNANDSNAAQQVAGSIGLRGRNEDTSTTHTIRWESFQASGTAVPTTPLPPNPTATAVNHYFYAFPDGEMDAYDMDNGHALVRRVPLPTSGALGVTAAPSAHALYISECGANCDVAGVRGSILKYDLVSDTVTWIATYAWGIDSMAITPDGSTLYSPDGEASNDGMWHVLDATSGAVKTSINAGVGGHNTVVSLNGSHAYLGGYQNGSNIDFLQQVDTSTNTIVKKIGPLTNGVRPFTVNGTETLAFTTATNFLGFQVSSIATGQVLYTVPISGFTWTTFVSTAPSHGISLSPDEKEVYVMDGPNDYVHVFDVSGLPSTAPKQVADIKLTPMPGSETPCASRCEKEGWILHSHDGRFVYVGDSGDVISTATRTIVANLGPLGNTRKFLELDWQNGAPIFTTTRHGLGYVTTPPPPTPTPTPTATPIPTPTPTPTATPVPTPTPTPSALCPSGALACDTYGRTVTGGWGTADVGGPWTITGNAANWNVAPGSGAVTVGASGQEIGSLSSVTTQDAEVLQKVVLPRSAVNNDLAYVLGRYTPGATPTYYRVGIGQGTGSTMILRGQRADGSFLIGDTDTGIPASAGAVVWLRVQFQGTTPTAIRARAWLDGAAEPTASWMLDTTDADPAEQTAGSIGIRDRNEDTTAARTFTYAQFQVTALAARGALCPSGAAACDTFNRTVSGGWGSADVGGAWLSTGSIYAVSPGRGTIVVNSTAPQTFLPSVSVQDVDARVWISMPTMGVTGDAGIAVRYGSAGGTYYQVSVYYPSGINGSNYVVQLKRKPENVLINPDFKTSIRGGTAVWIRMQAQGVNPTTLRWKVWQDGVPEPSAWTATGTDSNAPEQGAGGVGVEGFSSSGTATITFNSLTAYTIGTTFTFTTALAVGFPLAVGPGVAAAFVKRRRRRSRPGTNAHPVRDSRVVRAQHTSCEPGCRPE